MAYVRLCVLALLTVVAPSLCAPGTRTPTKYVVDLDAPAETRWAHVVQDYKQIIQFVHKVLLTYIPEELVPLADQIGADVDNYIKAPYAGEMRGPWASCPGWASCPMLPYIKAPYAGEMRGIAKALDANVGEVVIINLLYDVSAFCTSIVSQDTKGQIWHSRNLDYSFTDMLKNITVAIDFKQGGQVVYSSITYAGYIGVLTGQRPKAFSITVDERDQGNLLENLIVAILDRKTDPISFLVRDALSNDTTFEKAISRLAYTPTAADVYFIIAGMSPGEGAVITKGRLEPDDIWRLDPNNGRWYVVETNYDHWNPPPASDDRRTPAINAMNAMGRQGISMSSLFNVMSTHPVLNNHTTYTIVMSPAQPELMTTWIRP